MCHQISAVFACGHNTSLVEECTKAKASRLKLVRTPAGVRTLPVTKNLCTTTTQYPSRERTDLCLDCWAKKFNLIEVVDRPKGRDDIPPRQSYGSRHYPPHSFRRLFRQFTSSGDLGADANVRIWTPQRYREDERKNNPIAESIELAVAKTTKVQQRPRAAPPAIGPQKVKAKGSVSVKVPQQSQAAKGARSKK